MDFRTELLNLMKYCSDSANFITIEDSVEDRYAKQAYLDVIGKIGQIFEREQSPDTEPEQLPLHVVMPAACEEKTKCDHVYTNRGCIRCGKPRY